VPFRGIIDDPARIIFLFECRYGSFVTAILRFLPNSNPTRFGLALCPARDIIKSSLFYHTPANLRRINCRSIQWAAVFFGGVTMGWEYSEKTKQLFMDAVHGKPGTHLGEIESPDGVGEHGSLACGDAMRFTFRVRRHESDPVQDVITEARYLTFGCTSAIASSEALCAIIEQGNYTPITALKIRNSDIVDYLQGLPEQKIHCSVMGAEALEAAVLNWAERRNVDLPGLGIEIHHHDAEEGRMVCKCFSLTESYIKRKIRELNLRSIPEISNAIKAGGGCSSCHHAPGGLQDLLNEVWQGKPAKAAAAQAAFPILSQATNAPELSPFQFAILDIKGTLVYCRLQGACLGCIGASQTLKIMIERTLKEQVDERVRVIQV
jgi:NifU-like protein